MAGNSNLNDSARNKQDEFYTQLSLIESELKHYRYHFKDKTVLCNCDDPYESNFFKYFAMNFNSLGLKKLIATCYATSPICGEEMDYFVNSDGQLNWFEDSPLPKLNEKRERKPYKVEISEVTDENGDGRIDLADVEYLMRNCKNTMTLLEGGIYYNKYGNGNYDPKALEARIVELLDDEDVTNQKGIYEYLLDGQEKHLSIRAFSPKMARTAYERQKGICPKCKKHFEIEQMQADHITPWSKGGKTTPDNCQMLCADCNRRKSDM